MNYPLTFAAMLASLVAILAHQPEKRPGNLAPIQLISALGAWSLLVVDGVVASVAIAAGSVALAVVPLVTIVSAAIVFARGSGGERSARSLPDSVAVVIAEIRDLLGGARRLGLDQIDAVLASSSGPRIGVTTPARGRVVVRVHESMVAWIDRHLRAGGANAATVGSFIRFAVLHELGHILNGDHRTYHFARAVLISHLWWTLAAGVGAVSLASGDVPGARMALAATVFVALLVAAQSLIARRFIAERERLADWRAMQSLSMPDISRLLQRSGRLRSGRTNPTEIEKLMIDLKAEPTSTRPASLLSRAIRFVWPEGDSIHQRAEALAGDRGGAPAQPVRWAALAGLQCGVLTTSVAISVFLGTGPIRDGTTAFLVVMMVMCWVAGPAGTYCVIRTDPARLSVSGGSRTRQLVTTGLAFFVAFAAGIATTNCLLRWFSITAWINGLLLAVAVMPTSVVIGGCVVLANLVGGNDGGGELHDAPRAPWVGVVPLLAAWAIVLIPFNIAFCSWLGLGNFLQGAWVAVMLFSASVNLLSTEMARSPSAILRAAAPIATLGTRWPVYSFRFFWWEFFVDITRCSLARAGAVVFASQGATLLFLVTAAGFAMQRIEQLTDPGTAFQTMFLTALAFFMLFTRVPDRDPKMQANINLRLADRNRLELFGALLEGARHADELVAERIRSALARWMADDRLLPFLLPDRRTLWMLSPLLTLIRLARAAGALGTIERTRGQIETALRDVLTDDVIAVARGEQPSLYYSNLAVAIIDEAGLTARFPFSRMLDGIDSMLAERMASRSVNLVTDIVSAARLLQAHGRAIPEAAAIRRFVRRSTLMSKPSRHQSLVELCELADLLGDTDEKEKLAPIVRSRMWEVLQLNPRKEVLPLLDCYLAAVRLGERESALVSAAAATIAEIATRTADEFAAVLSHSDSQGERRHGKAQKFSRSQK